MPFSIDYAGPASTSCSSTGPTCAPAASTGLRNPSDRRTNYSVALRRAVPLTSGWYAPMLNGLALDRRLVDRRHGKSRSSKAAAQRTSWAATTGHQRAKSRRVATAAGDRPAAGQPAAIPRETDAIKNVRAQKYRWQPTQFRSPVRWPATPTPRPASRRRRHRAVRHRAGDHGLNHAWVNTARLEFRPTSGLTGSIDARQVLDLRDYRDADARPRQHRPPPGRRRRAVASSGRHARSRAGTHAQQRHPACSRRLSRGCSRASTSARPSACRRTPTRASLLREGDSTGAFRLPQRLGAAQSFAAGTQLQLGRLRDGAHKRERRGVHRVARCSRPRTSLAAGHHVQL